MREGRPFHQGRPNAPPRRGPGAALGVAERRARLDELIATLPPDVPVRLSPLIAFASWDDLAQVRARSRDIGAEGLMLCTNTMHRVADAIEAEVSIPLLHIADATAAAIVADGGVRVGLLGTRFTMEEDFYRDRLSARGLEVVLPDADDRATVHRVIYEELIHGHLTTTSRAAYRAIVHRLVQRGVHGVIAGCTEIELLLGPEDVPVPYYPTTGLQVAQAVAWLLADDAA